MMRDPEKIQPLLDLLDVELDNLHRGVTTSQKMLDQIKDNLQKLRNFAIQYQQEAQLKAKTSAKSLQNFHDFTQQLLANIKQQQQAYDKAQQDLEQRKQDFWQKKLKQKALSKLQATYKKKVDLKKQVLVQKSIDETALHQHKSAKFS